jgi:Arc/MetJ family transcription regulator
MKEVGSMSRTNIELDDQLVKEGLKLTHLKTKKDLVHQALEELVARKKRKGLLELQGKVRWQGNLDEMRTSRV